VFFYISKKMEEPGRSKCQREISANPSSFEYISYSRGVLVKGQKYFPFDVTVGTSPVDSPTLGLLRWEGYLPVFLEVLSFKPPLSLVGCPFQNSFPIGLTGDSQSGEVVPLRVGKVPYFFFLNSPFQIFPTTSLKSSALVYV
jgi:hypothetical protein